MPWCSLAGRLRKGGWSGAADVIYFDVSNKSFDPITPGQPSETLNASFSESNWDAIVGIRGLRYLSEKWYIPYSANAGAGESDFTGTAPAGFGCRFSSVDALFGWRYMSYDVGSNTAIKEITINGPFAGVMFRW